MECALKVTEQGKSVKFPREPRKQWVEFNRSGSVFDSQSQIIPHKLPVVSEVRGEQRFLGVALR